MTSLDSAIDELSTAIEILPSRAITGLFAACSRGLQPGFLDWATLHHPESADFLEQGLVAAFTYAREVRTTGLRDLLLGFERSIPDDTIAQDCWICADSAIRVAIDARFRPGPVIEYALEPLLQVTTESLFGVSQVGSGPDEESQVAAVMRSRRIAAALDFCRWAIKLLAESPAPTGETVQAVVSRATVLLP